MCCFTVEDELNMGIVLHCPLHCIALHWHKQLQKDFIIFHELKLYVIRLCSHKQIVCLVHITAPSNHHPTIIQRSRAAPKVPLWHPPTPPHKRTTSQWADLAASWRALGLPKRFIEPAMDTHVHLLNMNRIQEVSKRPTKSQAKSYLFWPMQHQRLVLATSNAQSSQEPCPFDVLQLLLQPAVILCAASGIHGFC